MNKTYAGLDVQCELDEQGNVSKTIVAGVAELHPDGSITYLHTDLLGSTVLLSDATGKILAEYEYDPFGEILGSTTSSATSASSAYLFTGQEYDAESELYYYNARYYSAETGRFLSRDLLKLNGDVLDRNGYAYVRNNPLKYVDPTGWEEKKKLDITDDFIRKLVSSASLMRSYYDAKDEKISSWIVPHYCTRNGCLGIDGLSDKLSNLSEEDIDKLPESVLVELEETPYKFQFFYQKVRTGGSWDYKSNDYAKYSTTGVYIGNRHYRYDDPGNIAYGYAGAAAGFSTATLKMLAGLNNKDTWLGNHQSVCQNYPYAWGGSYYDDPRDQSMIQYGVDLYRQYGTNKDRLNEFFRRVLIVPDSPLTNLV